jgi:arylsulfatase A-like enzyme
MKKTILTWLLSGFALFANEKPNILFIMSDDHTTQAIGAYGSRLASLNPTPTIDTIAKEGILMENAFCTNAICTPSRASIMTGQYSGVNGVTTLSGSIEHERQYLGLEMKKAGYDTAVIGKWHLKARPSAFDYYKVLPGQGKYFDPTFYEGSGGDREGTEVQMSGHSSDCIADSALEWFKTKRDKDKPFFLKFHFKAPHDFFESAPRYDSYLADVTIPEPASLWDKKNHGSIATRGVNDELLDQIGSSVGGRNKFREMGKDLAKRFPDEFDPSGITDPTEYKKACYQFYLKKYLRCVKGVDDNLKRVIDYLKAEGLYNNTIIIYTGDQGFFLGEHDYQDKRWAYEEALRMPFIVRYPKSIKAGSRSDAIIENVDYAPTMLAFAGLGTPEYMQGKSFKSILESGVEPTTWKKAAYYHYWLHLAHHWNPAHIAIRTKQHKLILFYGAAEHKKGAVVTTPPAWELYDLKNDPKEMNNIYDNPESASVIVDLKEQFKALRTEYKEDDARFQVNKVIDEYWDYNDATRQKAEAISAKVASGEISLAKKKKVKKKKTKKKS